jgi:hypothetical protein
MTSLLILIIILALLTGSVSSALEIVIGLGMYIFLGAVILIIFLGLAGSI